MSMPESQHPLRFAKTPFLRRHLHDAILWYPWEEESFRIAELQNKLLFLIVGYDASAETEAMSKAFFMHEQTARRIHENFIPLLLDLEEHPLIAEQYLEVAQAFFMEAVEWPLVFALLPNKKPIYIAKSLPLTPKKHEMCVGEFLSSVQKMRLEKGEGLEQEASSLLEDLSNRALSKGDHLPRSSLVKHFKEYLYPNIDPLFGGEKGAEKSINMAHLRFLLGHLKERIDDRSVHYITRTLDRGALGELHDPIHGGFFTYAKQRDWSDPKPEKSLSENAFLLETYLLAWKIFQDDDYKDLIIRGIELFLKQGRIEGGGFQSTLSTRDREGFFYQWSYQEFIRFLGEEKTKLWAPLWGLEGVERETKHYLSVKGTYQDYCDYLDWNHKQFLQEFELVREALLKERFKESPPIFPLVLLFDNSFFVALLADAGLVLDRDDFIKEALLLEDFLWKNFWEEDKLNHALIEKQALGEHSFADYVALIYAELALFEGGFGEKHLERSKVLAEKASLNFKEEGGAFFSSMKKQAPLFYHICELADDKLPSYNSLHAENLFRLYELTQREDYLEEAHDILKAAQPLMEVFPIGYAYHYHVLSRIHAKKRARLLIHAKKLTKASLQKNLKKHYLPYLTIYWDELSEKLTESLELTIGKKHQTYTLESLSQVFEEI